MGPKLRALVRSQQDKHPPVRCIPSLLHLRHVNMHTTVQPCRKKHVGAGADNAETGDSWSELHHRHCEKYNCLITKRIHMSLAI